MSNVETKKISIQEPMSRKLEKEFDRLFKISSNQML